jgi:hypothetical protein
MPRLLPSRLRNDLAAARAVSTKGGSNGMRHGRDALSGASLFSGGIASISNISARGRAGASRDKMRRSSRRAGLRHFVSGSEVFSVSALTALRCRYEPSRPKPFGETPKDFRPAPAERRALRPWCCSFAMSDVRFSIRRFGGNASSARRLTQVCRSSSAAHSSPFFLLPADLSNLRVPKSEGGRLMLPSWFLRFWTGQAGLG